MFKAHLQHGWVVLCMGALSSGKLIILSQSSNKNTLPIFLSTRQRKIKSILWENLRRIFQISDICLKGELHLEKSILNLRN